LTRAGRKQVEKEAHEWERMTEIRRKVPESNGGHGMEKTVSGWIMPNCRLLFNKGRNDREFQEELESHIQMHMEDNLRSGMTPEEARRQAMIKIGR